MKLKSVLTVDDSTIIRQLIREILERGGFDVKESVSGKKALETLKTSEVDLILLDVNMPGGEGVAYIKSIKKLPGYENTPILMLSSETRAVKKQVAKKFGAAGWIQKPINPTILLTAVNRYLVNYDEL